MALIARTGRHRQRYENHMRLVAGCIPYRLKPAVENHACVPIDRLEVLMISSPNRHDLVFPKGGWENDETVYEAACREALEEAGVRGVLHKIELGVWEFRSKSSEKSRSLEGSCRGHMFALKVTEELDCWPEQASHKRRWVNVMEAEQLCRYPWMREALKACIRRLIPGLAMPPTERSEPAMSYLFKPTERVDSAIDTCC
ncbi:putative NUDIX hydrolase domain-containing protein [Dioscorea sansibarensis]